LYSDSATSRSISLTFSFTYYNKKALVPSRTDHVDAENSIKTNTSSETAEMADRGLSLKM